MVEVDESYFLLRFTRNCVVEGAKRVRGKRGRGAGRKSFYFVTPSCPFARRYAKKLGLTLYARGKTLLGKRVASYYKGFYRSRKCHNFRKVSKSMMAWLIFASFCLATLQEGAKAHYRVKHSKNEFAKGRNHINEIVNFLLRARSYNYKQKGLCKVDTCQI